MSDLSIEDQRKILEGIASGDLTLEDLHNGNDLKYLEVVNGASVIIAMNYGSESEYYHNGCAIKPNEFSELTKGYKAKNITLNLNVAK